MSDFTDEQLRYLVDLVINCKTKKGTSDMEAGMFAMLNDELTRREELADLNFDCESCKL